MNKEFFAKAREVINRKLAEAAKELNIETKGLGNITYDSAGFHSKIDFLVDAKASEEKKIQDATLNLSLYGFGYREEVGILGSSDHAFTVGVNKGGRIIIDIPNRSAGVGKQFLARPEQLLHLKGVKETRPKRQGMPVTDILQKDRGMKFKVVAWVHPENGGDDREKVWYAATFPTTAEIASKLKGSAVKDDYKIIPL